MIVDSSAIVAILLAQLGYEPVLDKISRADSVGVGAPTLAETGIVVSSRVGVAGRTLLARLLQESGMAIVPFGDHHGSAAVDAFVRFGKGRHPAALSFGDCLT